MKLKLLSLVFLLSTVLSGVAAPNKTTVFSPAQVEQHRAMHWIVMTDGDTYAGCTAYAISPHVLLTAAHCDVEDAMIEVDPIGKARDLVNTSRKREITEKVYDHQDHMLLVIPSEHFDHVIVYDPDKYRTPIQGEKIYMWGNPAPMRDMYREGYISGTFELPAEENDDDDPIDASAPLFIMAFAGGSGDSGSSVFGSDGRIVTIVTYGMANGKMMAGYPLQFTAGQVKQAEYVKGVGDPKPKKDKK